VALDPYIQSGAHKHKAAAATAHLSRARADSRAQPPPLASGVGAQRRRRRRRRQRSAALHTALVCVVRACVYNVGVPLPPSPSLVYINRGVPTSVVVVVDRLPLGYLARANVFRNARRRPGRFIINARGVLYSRIILSALPSRRGHHNN